MIPLSKPVITKEAKEAVLKVLDSGNLAQGSKVAELENIFSKYCSSIHSIATNSGTSALHCALYALGIKEGDEVITTPFTFVASSSCILMQKAVPVFADIEPGTFNIDPQKIEEQITKKTKAILAVDLYGHPFDYPKISKIAKKHGLFLIEDACQSIGAEINGKKAGTLGDIATFSFYATKNLTSGEGGMITTDNLDFAQKARLFRHHGQTQDKRYDYLDLGYNYRMTEIAAAIATEQLRHLEKQNEQRIANAKFLTEQIAKIPQIEAPIVGKNTKHVFHQYTIKVPAGKRDAVISHLNKCGVGCGIYYPKPLHLFKMFLGINCKRSDLSVSEEMSKRVISLPVHPHLTQDQLETISNALKSISW